jgi:hypothetical protein
VRTKDVFRQANERIRQAAEDHAVVMRVPFLSECADPAWSQVVLLSLNDYRAVGADAAHFINERGHESAGRGVAKVVGRHDGSVVVEVGAHVLR